MSFSVALFMLVGCNSLSGFGLYKDPFFAVFDGGSGMAAYGSVASKRSPCGHPFGGSGLNDEEFCTWFLDFAEGTGGVDEGSSEKNDVLSFSFSEEASEEELLGRETDVLETPCYGEDPESVEAEETGATAEITELEQDRAVVELSGPVSGTIVFDVCR